MADPHLIDAFIEKTIAKKLDSQIQEKIDQKFDKTLGRWARRTIWAVGGVIVLVIALSLERIVVDKFARPIFNTLSGYDVSFSETLPEKFANYISSMPFLVSAYSHTEELLYTTCKRKIRAIPFHFEGDGQKVHLFFRFRPHTSSEAKMAIKGRVDGQYINDAAFDSWDGREWLIKDKDLTEFVETGASNTLKTRTLIVALQPIPDDRTAIRSIEDLSGTASLRTQNIVDDSVCVGMGGQLEILLKVIGDPRFNV